MGILESQFFADGRSYKTRPKLRPNSALQRRFDDALTRSEVLAQAQLARHDNDRNALFAVTLTSGLRADHAGAAERGHYLGPFAGIPLAIAYIREKQPESARRLLAQFQRQCPQNPLFARELAELDQKER